MHWAEKYVGQKWTPIHDCFYWFRKISEEQFGRVVPVCGHIDHTRQALTASRAMAQDITATYGYVKAKTPSEGDAVFMTQRCVPHHIGLAILIEGQLHVLHALDGIGSVVVSDISDLAANGWKIEGFWTYAS